MIIPKTIERGSSLVLVAVLAGGYAYAQDSDSEEEVFELSPFEVSSSDDVGYRANSTLAGSRLNTELKDVAASVSVLTSEFLDDVGASDIETAFAYVAGVETALVTDTSERGSSGELQDSSVNTQPGNNRVRGLARASLTRDFFESGNGNLDRYNVDRIALVRGPNSILFGLGSPAGIINYTTKKATTGKDINEISLKVDSFGTRRAAFDFNRAIGETFAIRLMKLDENTKSQYDTSFDKDDRLTVSLLAKPFNGTSLRYNFEMTDNDARRPNYSLPIDNISHWVAQGRPIWDIRDPANQGVFPATNFPGGPSGSANPASPETLNGGVEEINSPFPFTNIQFFLPGSEDPTVPFITTKGAVGFRDLDENGNYRNINLVEDDTRLVLARSRSAFDQVDNFINTSVTDPRIFPIYDINLAALPGNSQNRESETHHVSWTQKVTEDFHFEVSGFKDNTTNVNVSRFNGADRAVSIDLNPVLLDGVTANPGYLRPYISGRGGKSEREDDREAYRFSAAYDLDFRDVSDKLGFLGRHVFSGSLFDSSATDTNFGASPSSFNSDDALTFGLNRSIYGSWVFQNWYLGDPFTADQEFPNYTTYTTQDIDPSTPISVYRPENGATINDPLVWGYSSPTPTETTYSRASWNSLDVEGEGITWQGYLWNNKIVTTLGFREDTVTSKSANQDRDELTDLVDPSNPDVWGPAIHEREALARDMDPDASQTGSTSTKGIVFHAFDWLSLHYNESDNFEVGALRVYPTLDPIPNPSGVGEDIGIVMRLFENKLEVKLNRFESSQKNVSGRGTLANTARFGVNTYERFAWATIRNFRNNRIRDYDNGRYMELEGVRLSQQEMEDYFRYAWYDPDAPNKLSEPTEARYFAPANSDDTVDVDATGYELELTYNPTKNWRIAFNATKVQTIQDNIGPGFNEYVDARIQIWDKTWKPWSLYEADGTLVRSEPGIRFQDRSVQKYMIDEYTNRIVAAQNTAAAGEGRINVGQSEYAANLVTNYSFKDGRFKGMSIGANARWREGNAVGYPIIQTENGPASDLENPFYTDATLNVGLNASYRKKILDDSVTWITRLQINNLVGDDDIVLSAVNPDGMPAAYRAGRESFLQWTNTFRF
ncbi:TonB-dependent receptor plug domain-containing protein [Pelagicoccus sp. NFK12]|uniref:TonB-dependent receptor plug domain-containing protein n=1 Tax=Pelagicoccus enzymogenes TaxID=2773457 RepID=A0A927F811_9BACT|nr:TonB-dependent receptor plug domain-containing protein [Pelagicoccus enzymogenes]MBD5780039.1 TonB-dependent receptor plug domain-containing protein [Pelagicoccus enzymogenes]MDQ8198608.1 TonB-dependent receptor plug domain-containing protein [Pelagicoccus enzymogenes]